MASIPRSPTMIRATFFMAKFGDSGPPVELGVATWDAAYQSLYPKMGDGRPYKTFRNSIDTDRLHYIKCLAGEKTLSESRREIIGELINYNRSRFWASIKSDILPPEVSDSEASFSYPEEIPPDQVYIEGAARQIMVNAYERDPKARSKCIDTYGYSCQICKFNFVSRYGPDMEGFIHVHHIRPLSEIRAAYVVDPVVDLRPVCPNCHAVIHSRMPAYTIAEVQALLRE